ncbi:hypothetical protein LPJ57_002692 [Coemansia sp. RSA 486]|nr:hypothetical protein LPJ57_002692 [Coemansia sp. RSA 486]
MIWALRQRWAPTAMRLSSRRSTAPAHCYSTDKTDKTIGNGIHEKDGVSSPETNNVSDVDKDAKPIVKPDKRIKSRGRLEYMAVKQPSEALTRMSHLIIESQKPKDASNDIELFKFTTDDLFRDMLPLCAQKKKSLEAAEAYLATATINQRLDLVYECRQARVEQIKHGFNAKQLQEYLRQHGQKTQGTKDVLVGRIIDKVWGISGRDFDARLAKANETVVADRMELPLNPESWSQLQKIGNEFIEQLERDFKIKIELLHESNNVRASGDMHRVRGALSALREGLAAFTTVEVDLKSHGMPRKLSSKHMYRLTARVSHGSAATVTNFEGELFVSGERSDALNAQSALVDALTEDTSSVFYAVVPEPLTKYLSTTVAPAAAVFSKPRNYIFENAFHVAGVSEFLTPMSALSAHSLFSCSSGQEIKMEEALLIPTVAKWLEQRQQQSDRFRLAARLGRVFLDTDSEHNPLGASFYKPADLLHEIGQRSPLFDFVSYSSPLKWLNSGNSHGQTKTHVELAFRQVVHPEQATNKPENALPVCSADTLVARIPMEGARVLFDDMHLHMVQGLQNLNIAVLGAENDVQISGGHHHQIDCTVGHRQALSDAVRKLGLLGSGAVGSQPRRHRAVRLEQPEGLFSLQDVVLDKITTRRMVGGFVVDVHQTWNVVDDLRFSQVVLRPESGTVAQGQVDRFLGLLIEAAFERPTVPVTKAGVFSME